MTDLQYTSLRLLIIAWANLILAATSTSPWAMVGFGAMAAILFVADYFCVKLIQEGQT